MNNSQTKLIVDIKIRDKRVLELGGLQRGSDGAAGYDLRACIDAPLTLKPGESVLVDTGLSVFVKNPAYASVILPRSGLGHKSGIILGNSTGLIDSDYQGNLMMSLLNRKTEDFVINPLDRVAQLVFVPVIHPEFNIVDDFENSTDRGQGGFGSTKIK